MPVVSRVASSDPAASRFEADEPAGHRGSPALAVTPFLAEPLSGLSGPDRERFGAFGRGPIVRPTFRTLTEGFQRPLRTVPDGIAVEHLGQRITYRELDRQARRLAGRMREAGVRPGDRVGLFVQRSIDMVIGIVATLKLGAAYVPQCAGIAPTEQIRQVMLSAGIDVVLCTRRWRDALPRVRRTRPITPTRHDEGDADDGLTRFVVIDERSAQPVSGPPWSDALDTAPKVSPDDLCFVLFTSGTTGRPNGVMVTHANACNIIATPPGDLGLRPGMRIAQLLNIGFDMAAWEVLGALTHGATLVIRGSDFQAVAETVDVIVATPSILATLDERRCSRVRVVAVAGEACPRPLADRWAASRRFYNGCGPTEVTIVNTMQEHRPGNRLLTIGGPTPNNAVYVLDAQGRPCAIGETGVMWAGGAGVTRGYIANDELTRERYAADPFIGGDARMFNTRDLGRWTGNGELEHLGRIDDQVKVRGFRVELDSVSAVIERTPGCSQAVTLKLDDRELVSFVAPVGVDVERARALVAEHLPYYCVPARVHALASLPMTERGKVDKRALLALAAASQMTTGKNASPIPLADAR